jgi:TonB family protein
MSRFTTFTRFLVSGLIAVAILLFGGGWIVHHFFGPNPSQSVGLTVIRNVKLLAHVPGSATRKKPAVAERKRTVAGIVQIGFTVGADGRAHNIRVLRSAPKGANAAAARAVIAARHFTPPQTKRGRKIEHSEILHFQVPANAPKKSGKNANSGD